MLFYIFFIIFLTNGSLPALFYNYVVLFSFLWPICSLMTLSHVFSYSNIFFFSQCVFFFLARTKTDAALIYNQYKQIIILAYYILILITMTKYKIVICEELVKNNNIIKNIKKMFKINLI